MQILLIQQHTSSNNNIYQCWILSYHYHYHITSHHIIC